MKVDDGLVERDKSRLIKNYQLIGAIHKEINCDQILIKSHTTVWDNIQSFYQNDWFVAYCFHNDSTFILYKLIPKGQDHWLQAERRTMKVVTYAI